MAVALTDGLVCHVRAPWTLGAPEAGLPVFMFAGELATVVQTGKHCDQLPGSLAAASEQAVTASTVTGRRMLVGLVDAEEALSALAS
jgi:hypothetical protein